MSMIVSWSFLLWYLSKFLFVWVMLFWFKLEESVLGIKASKQRFEPYENESRGTCRSVLTAMAESEKGELHESLGYDPADFGDDVEWEEWPSQDAVGLNEFPEG